MNNKAQTHRRRPPRIGQIFQSIRNPLYFVTMVTWKRQSVLANERVHNAFRHHAFRQRNMGVSVGQYVIMPDHIHLFISIGHNQKLGESVKHLKQCVTKRLRETDSKLKVWQPGFFNHLLRNSESYIEKWRYMAENPIRAGLCKNAKDWPYQGEISHIDRA